MVSQQARSEAFSQTPGGGSQLSIIVPCYNDASFLEACLSALRSLTGGLEGVEIIVVDNGSTDESARIASRFTVDLLRSPRVSISEARNLGRERATGATLAFIDSDVVVTARWVAAALEHAERRTVLAGYPYIVRDDASVIERAWFRDLYRSPNYFPGGNFMMSAELFDALGGFDPEWPTGEDVDLFRRSVAREAVPLFDPELEAIHLGYSRTLKGFMARERWHGAGDFRDVRSVLSSRVALYALCFTLLGMSSVLCAFAGQLQTSAICGVAAVGLAGAMVIRKFGFSGAATPAALPAATRPVGCLSARARVRSDSSAGAHPHAVISHPAPVRRDLVSFQQACQPGSISE